MFSTHNITESFIVNLDNIPTTLEEKQIQNWWSRDKTWGRPWPFAFVVVAALFFILS